MKSGTEMLYVCTESLYLENLFRYIGRYHESVSHFGNDFTQIEPE
jgi:hypothetical protein